MTDDTMNLGATVSWWTTPVSTIDNTSVTTFDNTSVTTFPIPREPYPNPLTPNFSPSPCELPRPQFEPQELKTVYEKLAKEAELKERIEKDWPLWKFLTEWNCVHTALRVLDVMDASKAAEEAVSSNPLVRGTETKVVYPEAAQKYVGAMSPIRRNNFMQGLHMARQETKVTEGYGGIDDKAIVEAAVMWEARPEGADCSTRDAMMLILRLAGRAVPWDNVKMTDKDEVGLEQHGLVHYPWPDDVARDRELEAELPKDPGEAAQKNFAKAFSHG